MTTELRELLAKATDGPWSWATCGFDNYAFTIGRKDPVENMTHVIADVCIREPAKANAALIVAAVNALPALLDRVEALEAENGRLREALTPSADTKAAYIGEIKYSYVEWDEFGDERTVTRTLEWSTTKEVMAMISARAALSDPAS